MTHLLPADFIRFLNQIYPSSVPFAFYISHRKTKKRGGTYFPHDHHIILYDHWGGDEVCKQIAIHEYSHLIHHVLLKRDESLYVDKSHGEHFWQIYGALMAIAHAKGLYTSEYLFPLLNKTL